eukprot:g6371.t1
MDVQSMDDYLREINSRMQMVQEAAYHFKGTLRQFIQDDKGTIAIVCVGLPPLFHEDNAARGVKIAQRVIANGVKATIGVTTGTCFCGIVGRAERREYMVVGDAVNMAARLMVTGLKQGSTLKAKRGNVSADDGPGGAGKGAAAAATAGTTGAAAGAGATGKSRSRGKRGAKATGGKGGNGNGNGSGSGSGSGGLILCDATTVSGCRGAMKFESRGKVTVKGKDVEIEIFEPSGGTGSSGGGGRNGQGGRSQQRRATRRLPGGIGGGVALRSRFAPGAGDAQDQGAEGDGGGGGGGGGGKRGGRGRVRAGGAGAGGADDEDYSDHSDDDTSHSGDDSGAASLGSSGEDGFNREGANRRGDVGGRGGGIGGGAGGHDANNPHHSSSLPDKPQTGTAFAMVERQHQLERLVVGVVAGFDGAVVVPSPGAGNGDNVSSTTAAAADSSDRRHTRRMSRLRSQSNSSGGGGGRPAGGSPRGGRRRRSSFTGAVARRSDWTLQRPPTIFVVEGSRGIGKSLLLDCLADTLESPVLLNDIDFPPRYTQPLGTATSSALSAGGVSTSSPAASFASGAAAGAVNGGSNGVGGGVNGGVTGGVAGGVAGGVSGGGGRGPRLRGSQRFPVPIILRAALADEMSDSPFSLWVPIVWDLLDLLLGAIEAEQDARAAEQAAEEHAAAAAAAAAATSTGAGASA